MKWYRFSVLWTFRCDYYQDHRNHFIFCDLISYIYFLFLSIFNLLSPLLFSLFLSFHLIHFPLTLFQVNEQIGSGDWTDGTELGSTWEGRNSFSYGRASSSVGKQSTVQVQAQVHINW